jgi:DNA-directed RNA polymerase subunit K/omega
LFFSQAGGREGLINTSITTSQTGYTQRRLIKAMESTSINYDGSIRNNIGKNMLISGFYNCGYDPAHNLLVEDPDKHKYFSFIDISDLTSRLNSEKGWILQTDEEKIKSRPYTEETSIISDEFEEVALPKSYPTSYPEPWQILTKYEKCRLIGSRAEQIDNNAPPLITDVFNTDPLNIAEREFEQKLIPLHIIRTYPNGRKEAVNNRNTVSY